MRKTCLSLIWAAILGCLCPALALAGGMWMYESGTPDMGTASAGRAALAEDASTAFGNPAGMTRLDRTQAMVAVEVVAPSIHFDVDKGTTLHGGGGGNSGVTMPGGGVFFVYKYSPQWSFGVAANSYAGGVLDYGNSWAGRFYAENSDIITFNVNPSAAYRVNDWLSIGAGLDVMYGYFKSRTGIPNIEKFSPDGSVSLKADAAGVGGNVGILVEPCKGTRIGLTYRSPIDLNFSDVPQIAAGPFLTALLNQSGLANKEVDLGVTIPQEVALSLYQDITDRFALVASFGWQNWSQFGKVDVGINTVNGISITSKVSYDDTFQFAIGGRYKITDPLMLMAGFAFDTSANTESTRTAATPFDRQLRYALGLQYAVSDQLSVGVAYEFMDAGPASINRTRGPLSGTLVGDYSSNYYNFLGCNVNYKF